MRNTRWLRYGLASIIVAGTGLGATLVACGDDDVAGSSSGTVPEGGNPSDSPSGDTSIPVDAADGAPKPNLAKLTFVNATTDMGPNATLNVRGDAAIRLCFKQGTTAANLGVAPYPPLPDKPKGTLTVAGVPYGAGGTFPSFGLDLEGRIIQPIIMNVRSLVARGIKNPGTGQPGTTCDELVGDTADAAANLLENTDYWILPQVPAGTLKKEKSYVFALTGCVGDSALNPGKECGAGFTPGGVPGVGNLKITVFETNTTPVSATQLGVQFFHASAQTDAVFGPGAANPFPLTPGFTVDPTDAGPSFRPATAAPIVINTLSPVQGVTGVKDSDFFALDKVNPAAPTRALAPFPLPLIQALSGLGLPAAPTVYTSGANYVFIAVGDPLQPTFSATDGGGPGDGGDGTSFNTRSLHFLAFPTDPVIEPYKP
jgi:hypothetical protein